MKCGFNVSLTYLTTGLFSFWKPYFLQQNLGMSAYICIFVFIFMDEMFYSSTCFIW